jgi:hypothetical protein
MTIFTLNKERTVKYIWLIAMLPIMTGCITTYRDFPQDAKCNKQTNQTCDVIYYNVKRFDILDSGGFNKLNADLKKSVICKKGVSAETAPDKGLFIEVEAKWKPMSMPAFIFGYISLSTLTILPAWSTEDGYAVTYNIYIDKQLKDTYQYDITRKTGLWLGLLPFAWLNWITYSEVDAFDATTCQIELT